ncbi:Protein RETARDED ROOT GROWTH [Cardamine amara subsp. amara]|uniref:Protein RETARDED ROOT GROWTH n=1 Tax=Cardamine amara subsp. amara TaxID=228776 RepID=A0ABD1BMP0_CARAN
MGRWRAVAALILRNQILNSSKRLDPSTRVSNHPGFGVASRLLKFRYFSAFPSPISIYNNDSDSGSSDVYQNYEFGTKEEEERGKIPVKAYFLSTSIDLKGMQADNLCNVVPPTSRSTNSIALKFSDFHSGIHNMDESESVSNCRFIVVFQYGSAVLFNIDDNDIESYLDIVRRHASGLLTEMRKDDYAVKEKPLLTTEMQGGPDYIVLKTLDTDSIRIIGSVLGQSIALDYFVSQVDKLVEEFACINRAMEKTGTFTMHRKKLFQLVGKANSNLANVILKVGLFERSEIAWRQAKYAQIHEYLREEYEVTQRFGNLDYKLKFVEHNIHFLQEVMQNRRSDLLEWCIIFLLTLENALSIYEIVRESTGVSL